ncbi:TniQ family protein [Photobacterium chitinilyticum]|uniref:TniQ domain-containing protein n=1 Tax=Photobacterium chitinilyticum TaxID=2485123 RepID=A0A3S3R6C1_9GAMM|nr:TniQ family protein [Photobacterium chitinilyticum]RWX53415.1 hypothetical protein EDI28_21575 [Photobacterium chitinilyticum]
MFLITPDKQYLNESLESFLIRLGECNGFESFQLLSGALWEWLVDNDHRAAGALPRQLNQFNLYHAKHSSGFRVRAFELLDSLFDSDVRPLMSQALLRSTVTFSPNLTSVFRAGVHIPRCFIRSSHTPVCPKCLAESPYIRQYWHFQPYQSCHHHGVKLLFHCPSCKANLNYQESEQIEFCECGYDLRKAEIAEAAFEQVAISKLVADGEREKALSVTNWLGALLWYSRYKQSLIIKNELDEQDFSPAVQYFSNWPSSFCRDLEGVVQNAEMKLLKNFNHTRFSSVFGELLTSARKLPSKDLRQNFVLKAVIGFLYQLVRDNPKTMEANIADLRLTVLETAALLTTSTEQVYRLHEEGYLQSSRRLKLHSKLRSDDAVFFLRHVMELRWSGMASDYSTNDVYLPSW